MSLDALANYPTGNFCNAYPDARMMAPNLKPLSTGRRIVGRARTARTKPGHNAAIHRAVHVAQPGDLLVVDGGGSDRSARSETYWRSAACSRGSSGAVIDGTVRDSADIAAMGFQVFARGFHPEATVKDDPGDVDIPVTVGGVVVHPGDIVVADDDGVVVFGADVLDVVEAEVARVAEREEAVRARIKAGETTFDIFGLQEP